MATRLVEHFGRGLVVTGALVIACSPSPSDAPTCRTPALLFAASDNESYLGLGSEQTHALVAIVDDAQPDRVRCTATFITEDWLVTAAHCLEDGALTAQLTLARGTPPALLPIVASVAHPDLDVALVQVDRSTAAIGQVELVPLGVFDQSSDLSPGTLLELAGYGLTETGASQGLRFVLEPIVALDGETVTVDGSGSSGACSGDSGGPLLLRDGAGAAVVLGVLSLGSVSCRDRDTYTRLDSITDFITAVTGPLPPPTADCGNIDSRGRCLDDSALWCDGGVLRADACSKPERCGWDDGALGFRCGATVSDACRCDDPETCG